MAEISTSGCEVGSAWVGMDLGAYDKDGKLHEWGPQMKCVRLWQKEEAGFY